MSIEKQPVNQVMWVDRNLLKANDYNPNSVAPAEMELLKISIREDGWTQPIVINPDYSIVDGFHRWTVSGTKEIFAMTDGKVPVVMLNTDVAQRMMSTIRHNRARGTHAVLKMADIVEKLVLEGCTSEEIQKRLGMEDEEVERLMSKKGIDIRVSEVKTSFSKGFVPDVK